MKKRQIKQKKEIVLEKQQVQNLIILLSTTIILVIILFFNLFNDVKDINLINAEKKELEKYLAELNLENQELANEINYLSDEDYLNKILREKYHVSEETDILFYFE